jgi:hypothetical protein
MDYAPSLSLSVCKRNRKGSARRSSSELQSAAIHVKGKNHFHFLLQLVHHHITSNSRIKDTRAFVVVIVFK